MLAYQLIAGTHPFAQSRAFGEMVAAHINARPMPLRSVRPDVPADVDALIGCLLEKNPDRRYPDTATLAAQIHLMLAGAPPEPGATIPTNEGEEDTMVGEQPKPPGR